MGDEFRVVSLRERSGDSAEKAAAERPDSLTALAARLGDFRAARDWERFHTPRSLAISIAVEAGELLEQFQWVNEDELADQIDSRRESIREEIADVVIYAVQLADVLDLPLAEAIHDKIDLNESRYPAERSRGSARKYTDFPSDDPVAGSGS